MPTLILEKLENSFFFGRKKHSKQDGERPSYVSSRAKCRYTEASPEVTETTKLCCPRVCLVNDSCMHRSRRPKGSKKRKKGNLNPNRSYLLADTNVRSIVATEGDDKSQPDGVSKKVERQ